MHPQPKAIVDASSSWDSLVAEFVPLRGKESEIWRSSRPMHAHEPDQGWKLHVSSTVPNARTVLWRCGRYLRERDVLFKACATLDILQRLNSGIFYGFSQVGKFITVYPASAAQAVELAAGLHDLTSEFPSPKVPYDLPFRPRSSVFYRYGGFRNIEVVFPDGSRNSAIRDPSGKYWTDRREPGHAVPMWLMNPFEIFPEELEVSPLCTRFLTYEALMQRGKGGTYLSVDIQSLPARKCVLKEGRRHGETGLDGRDGHDYLVTEELALRRLGAAGLAVPAVLDAFTLEQNRYLAIDYIDAENLMTICSYPRRRLPEGVARVLSARVADVVAGIHDAGLVWRDCKPMNLLVNRRAEVWAIDFEGAVGTGEPTSVPWGTPGYTPPELKHGPVTGSNIPEDLFALGATLHQIFTSVVPVRDGRPDQPLPARLPVGKVRKGLPAGIRECIDALTGPDPRSRPTARQAADILRRFQPEAAVEIEPSEFRRKRPPRPKAEALNEDSPGIEKVVLHAPPADRRAALRADREVNRGWHLR